MSDYSIAKDRYAELGVDTDRAIARAAKYPISIHCWQADDVAGFEPSLGAGGDSGIMATGSFPGRARNGDELRSDMQQVLRLVPGAHRLNLHAIYAEPMGKPKPRDEVDLEQFSRWIDWAKECGLGLDFNPTYFAHPMASSGATLSSADENVRRFWIRHGIASRRIAAGIAKELGSPCVNNHWIPDGAKDSPADRWSPRARLRSSYDEILAESLPGCIDSIESKLFGLGSEDYVVGSYEFCASYTQANGVLLCLDMGHFHPTESVADKLSGLMQFREGLLLHASRPMRWDSDHVVLFDDVLRSVFLELARGKAIDRATVALDFFDASINRIAAYVIGIRATRKAMLYALLDPSDELRRLEREGKLGEKLALMEEAKTLPFGFVWEELCRRANVPAVGWMAGVDEYSKSVLANRN